MGHRSLPLRELTDQRLSAARQTADCSGGSCGVFATHVVIADKALKGEGRDDEGKLLALGRSLFLDREMKAATREVIPPKKRGEVLQKLEGELLRLGLDPNATLRHRDGGLQRRLGRTASQGRAPA